MSAHAGLQRSAGGPPTHRVCELSPLPPRGAQDGFQEAEHLNLSPCCSCFSGHRHSDPLQRIPERLRVPKDAPPEGPLKMGPGLTPDGTSLSLYSNNESLCAGTTLRCGKFFLAPRPHQHPWVSLFVLPLPAPHIPPRARPLPGGGVVGKIWIFKKGRLQIIGKRM